MKNTNRRWIAILLASLMAAALIAGCGGSTTTTTTTSTTKSDTQTDIAKPTDQNTQTFQKDPNTSLTVDKTEYKPGDKILVTFKAPTSYSGYAWIGVIPSKIKHGSEDENDKNDTDFAYLEGKAQGVIELEAPQTAGDYDIRMNSDDDAVKGKEVNYVSFKVKL